MKKLFLAAFSLLPFYWPNPASPQQEILPPRAFGPNHREIGIPYLRNYAPKEYGADVQNWAIVQDQRGVMYFGNNSGVLEYDGVSWRLIPTANRSAVRSLAVGDDGKIYVGAQGEIGYLAPSREAGGQLQYVSLRDSVAAEYRDFADIAKIYTTAAGVYFQALDRVFRWSNRRLRVWKPASPFHLSFVVQDRFYIRQPGVGLLQMQGDSLRLAPNGEKFAEMRIYLMLPYGEENILVGTREQGLFLYDGASAKPFPTEVDAFLLEKQIYHGAVLSNNTFALATLRGGVAIIDKEGELQQLLNKAAGIQDDNVKFLFPDRQGGLWLALDNGLSRVEAPAPFSIYDERTGLKGDVEFMLRHQGTLYAANGLGVFYLQPRSAGSAGNLLVQPPRFTPVSGIAAQSWSLLAMGKTLLAATGDGVYQIQGGQATLVRESDRRSLVLLRSQIDTTRIYIGREDGLAALRFLSNSRNEWFDEGKIKGIDAEVRSMVETNEGILWLGTRSQGVIRVDFSAGFSNDPKVENMDSRYGFPAEPGWVIVFSASGEQAFATDKGIFRFDQKRKRFLPDSTFASVRADSSRIISEVNTDRAGNVWMQAGGELGVALRQRDGAYRWHTTPFKRCVDFNVWSIYPEDDGLVWLGGPNGLVRYDATVQKDFAVDFAALIRRVIVDPDSVIWDGANVDGMNRREATAVLAYANNALRFEVSATSYDDPSANRFQYFLDGFDKSWSAWTKETKKDYTNLPEGESTFRVRAKNIYDHVGREAVYAFKILPPWYRTWWAYLFYLGALALSVYGFIKYRTRQLEQKSRALEKVVQQRTDEIRQQAEELETLDGIVKVINQEVALESVLNSLLQEGLRLFPQAEKASVLLFDHQAECFKFAAAVGYDWSLLKNIAFTPEQMANRYTIGSEEMGTGVYIIRELKKLYDEEILNLYSQPKSVLSMTAVWEGKLEAYLIFDNLSDAEAFDHSDARKLNRFRSHAISAIAKAKMLQELQDKNAEIIRTQEQLIMQEKLASLGGLTAGIAHEIKNPLNFVNNFAELSVELAKELRTEIEKQKDRMEAPTVEMIDDILRDLEQNTQKINEHGKRADGIVRSMLMYSRGQTETREATDLNAMLEEDLNLAYHGMRAQDVSFNIKIEKDFDASVGAVEVLPQELSRVFLNIINNACYAANQKKKTLGDSFSPTLSVRSKNLGDKVEIRIRDNGSGIPEAIRNKIFNPFFTTKPTGQGTGLGLSISYEIVVQKHNGEIKVETEDGQFTEFIIVLPKSAEGGGQRA
jgi:signal transduction histidine kinase/ligand-binding sensor domain-containing protein